MWLLDGNVSTIQGTYTERIIPFCPQSIAKFLSIHLQLMESKIVVSLRFATHGSKTTQGSLGTNVAEAF